jgi:uncharacterized DUF497 family protein
MTFDWDKANTEHVRLHEISKREAEEVAAGNPVEIGQVERNRETRTVLIGQTERGKVLVVVTTQRGEKTRVVTAYPANRSQRALYVRMKGTK